MRSLFQIENCVVAAVVVAHNILMAALPPQRTYHIHIMLSYESISSRVTPRMADDATEIRREAGFGHFFADEGCGDHSKLCEAAASEAIT